MTYSQDGGVVVHELSAGLLLDEKLLQVHPQLSVEDTVEEKETDALQDTAEGLEVRGHIT